MSSTLEVPVGFKLSNMNHATERRDTSSFPGRDEGYSVFLSVHLSSFLGFFSLSFVASGICGCSYLEVLCLLVVVYSYWFWLERKH
jgi:hypothetical protein